MLYVGVTETTRELDWNPFLCFENANILYFLVQLELYPITWLR